MPIKYIIAIVICSLFAVIFVIYLITSAIAQKKREELMESLEKMYSDSNVAKMEYDFAVYDEETETLLSDMQSGEASQPTIGVVDEEAVQAENAVFGTVDTEGLEEITGNYKPE